MNEHPNKVLQHAHYVRWTVCKVCREQTVLSRSDKIVCVTSQEMVVGPPHSLCSKWMKTCFRSTANHRSNNNTHQYAPFGRRTAFKLRVFANRYASLSQRAI